MINVKNVKKERKFLHVAKKVSKRNQFFRGLYRKITFFSGFFAVCSVIALFIACFISGYELKIALAPFLGYAAHLYEYSLSEIVMSLPIIFWIDTYWKAILISPLPIIIYLLCKAFEPSFSFALDNYMLIVNSSSLKCKSKKGTVTLICPQIEMIGARSIKLTDRYDRNTWLDLGYDKKEDMELLKFLNGVIN